MKTLTVFVCALALGSLWTRAASAVPVTGGETTLIFDPVQLDDLDVEISANDAAAPGSGPGVWRLPITGGDLSLSPLAGSVEHNGSGLEFDFGDVSVDVDDWEFDFTDLLVNADLSAGAAELSTGVFDIVPCSSGGCTGSTDPANEFGLFLRPDAADFFENVVFDDNGFDDGDQIALARISTEPVPEPQSLGLAALLSAGLLSARRAARRRATGHG